MPQPSDEAPRPPLPEVGLCSACCRARVQTSARGQRFWRCMRADSEPAFRRYPALPVRTCPGFDPGTPTVQGSNAG
jgi:hypothetical protein